MNSYIKKIKTILVVLSLCSSFAFAQTPTDYVPKQSGPREQLAITIFAGLGGAVLGLSTLSFYDRPQDHLVNIAIGFAIGVIGGTIYSTYQMATRPYSVSELHGFGHADLNASLTKHDPVQLKASFYSLDF
jgi:hypothetical protein